MKSPNTLTDPSSSKADILESLQSINGDLKWAIHDYPQLDILTLVESFIGHADIEIATAAFKAFAAIIILYSKTGMGFSSELQNGAELEKKVDYVKVAETCSAIARRFMESKNDAGLERLFDLIDVLKARFQPQATFKDAKPLVGLVKGDVSDALIKVLEDHPNAQIRKRMAYVLGRFLDINPSEVPELSQSEEFFGKINKALISYDMKLISSGHWPQDETFYGDLQKEWMSFQDECNNKEHTITIHLLKLSCEGLAPKDSNGLSDPFVVFGSVLQGKHHKLYTTDVIKKSLNPSWDLSKDLTFKYLEEMNMEVRDKDFLKSEFEGILSMDPRLLYFLQSKSKLPQFSITEALGHDRKHIEDRVSGTATLVYNAKLS